VEWRYLYANQLMDVCLVSICVCVSSCRMSRHQRRTWYVIEAYLIRGRHRLPSARRHLASHVRKWSLARRTRQLF